MHFTPYSELEKRIQGLQKAMDGAAIDGVLIMQGSDLFYYSGVFQNGALYIPVQGKPLLMVRRSVDRAATASALENIVLMKSLRQIPDLLKERGYEIPHTLGLELDVITAQMYLSFVQLFDGSRIVDCAQLIKMQRAVKSAYEIGLIKKAAALTDDFFRELPGIIIPGKQECDAAGQLEHAARRRGHQGVVRMRGFNNDFHYGCFLSGESGGVAGHFDGPLAGPGLNPSFPFGAGGREIGVNEPVMVDYVGAFEGYCIDMSRVFVVGKLSGRLELAHDVALEIQNRLVALAKPGAVGDELYRIAVELAEKAGLADHFMGFENRVSFVAHGVGIELNELPLLARGVKDTLEENMVIALEPKFIFPGQGAAGVENTFVVTAGGLERLSSYPDQIITI